MEKKRLRGSCVSLESGGLVVTWKICLYLISIIETQAVNFSTSTTDVKYEYPVILWWTGRLFPHIDVNRTLINCSKGSCITTYDRSFLLNRDMRVVLFYGSDLQVEDMPLPRLPHHSWALFHEESPLNNFMFSHLKGIRLFNYTATFRRESDYPLTTQFVPSVSYLLDRMPYPTEQKNALRRQGYAPIIYVQSHCHVPSDRDRYVYELAKHVQIDSYGLCLHNKDLPPQLRSAEKYNDEAFLDFTSHYKFHVAFENSICDDYVTEKLFRALHVGSVPIYLGASTVSDWLPSNHSAIVVSNFESPSKLAQYILMLESNDKLYDEYLEYKDIGIQDGALKMALENREWGVNEFEKIDFFQGFECYLCDEITVRRSEDCSPSGEVSSSKMADNNHMGCPEPYASYLPLGENVLASSDEWMKQEWAEAYWYSYDQARALEQMILRNESDSSRIHDVALELRYTN